MDPSGWKRDACCLFHFRINDSAPRYSLYVDLRLRKDFAYKEIPLFITIRDPRGDENSFLYLYDLSRFEYAKNAGAWTDYRAEIRSGLVFSVGNHCLKVSHNSPDTLLRGIGAVGILLKK